MNPTFTKIYFLLITLLYFTGVGTSQVSFTDDFEAYTVSEYLGNSSTNWTTWSNKPGTEEDVKVTDEKALSGTKSLKFSSTLSTGGPQDVILPFGKRYTSGSMKVNFNFFIPQGKSGYFNVQGGSTVGTSWSLDVNFRADGLITVSTGSVLHLVTEYTSDAWFKFGLDVNLTANLWKVLVNDECKGAFTNSTNAMASIDLYPSNEVSLFYVDDVSFEYDTSAIVYQFEGGVSGLNWGHALLSGEKNSLSFTLSNHGTQTITDIEVMVDKNGEIKTVPITGLNIAAKKSQIVTLTEDITLSEGVNAFSLELVKINDSWNDLEPCNNRDDLTLNAYTPAEDKATLIEEGTGTWCQWCPRGAVFMDLLSERYPNKFIPIAVHNSDPMEVAEYDSFITGLPGFEGFPSVVVNRKYVFDPSQMETPFLERLAEPTIFKIRPGAKFDETTRILDVSTEIEFKEDASGDYFVSLVLTEDGVKGTTSGFNQSNAYAGGTAGVMGGYESLPNPVPAASMVYDHVARAILFKELAGENFFSGDFKAGDKVLFNFQYKLPATQNIENFNIVPIVSSLDYGYENAAHTSISEAIANGFLVSSDDPINVKGMNVFPNPTSDVLYVDLNVIEPTNVTVQVQNINGSIVAQRNFGVQSGALQFPIDVRTFVPGTYISKIITGNSITTRKFVVVK
ncbi:MAG: Omp28-related outer membrane protein [Saprospiraceae bacterium]